MVSSTEGSATNTFWKRRSSAASFRCTDGIHQASSPRRSAVHHAPAPASSMLPASIAPSALPAPTMVCSSSINRMTLPSLFGQVGQHAFPDALQTHRGISPRPPAPHIQRQYPTAFQPFWYFAVDDTLRQAFDDCRFTHPGFTDQHRVVFGTTLQYLNGTAESLHHGRSPDPACPARHAR